MLTGSVLALFWVLIATIGALGGLVFIAGLRGAGLVLALAFLLPGVHSDANANTFYKDTGWKLEPDVNGVYSVLPEQGRGGATTSGCTTTACTRSGGLGGPLGKPRPTLTPSTTFPKANIASSALALGSRALPWLSVGYGLYDWYNSAGLTLDENGLNAAEPYNPAVLGSGTWTFEEAPSKTLGYGSPDSACTAYNSWRSTVGLIPLSGIYARQTGGGYVCTGAFPDGVISWTAAIVEFLPSNRCPFGSANSSGQCPYTPTSSPISESDARQRLIDAPITSDILRRSFDEILDAGGGVASTGTTVSGPSSAPGETTTRTTTAANGTTQVSTTTTNYNYTYNDNRVTVTETNTTQNPDGSTQTETTDKPPEPQPSPAVNPAMPDIPQLYEPKYPAGIAGVWADKKTAFQQTPIFAFLASLVPSWSDGGCPSWSIPVMYGLNDIRDTDISLPCWVWSACRAFITVTALLLCRRLIFGG